MSSSDNESEISSLTPSQEDDSKKEGDSADEQEEEQENPPNYNADHLVGARSSLSPALLENEIDYEEEDAINLGNNDVNYEEDDQQLYKVETHMPEAEELLGEDISAGESDEEEEKVDRRKNCEEESKIKQEEEEGKLDNLEEGEIIDSDDGIPEIKESMSPPETTDDFSKSFETHNNYTHDNNIGSYQQHQYEHKERETCRFFLRGNCKNGNACRFKHSFTANARVQYQSTSTSNTFRPPNYIPPPIGPPIPLLSTEFIAPPSLAPLIRPSAPVNTDSAAWEQGLKKAREIVRRQKTETTPIKGGDDKEEEDAADNKSDDSFGKKFEKSPPRFAAAEITKSKVEEAPRHFQQHRQYFPPSNTQNHHHRPIASRMVVEYVSVVTSPSTGGGSYGQRKGSDKSKSKASIPSLIDNIIDKPVSPPQRGSTSTKIRQRDTDGRRTFKTNNYADPWSRQNSSGGDHDSNKRDGRRNQQLGRKRRRSSSTTSSSSNEGTTNRRRRPPSPSTHSHSTSQQTHHQQHKSISRHSNEPLSKETSMERGDGRKAAKCEEINSTSKVNLRRNDSASSHTSISSSKKGEKKAITRGRQPSSRSSSVSLTTSTSSDSSREAVTLGSLLKINPHDIAHQSGKSKGPKTPPTPLEQQRPGSECTSASSRTPSAENNKIRGLPSKHTDKSENRQSRQNSIKLDQQKRFSRGSNQSIESDGKRRNSQLLRSSFLKNEENEEEDAPAAYRISRKPGDDLKQKRRNDRASSSSSLSSSSSSSSSSFTSSSSTIGHEQRKNKPAGDEKTIVTICSSERNIHNTKPFLDDKVAPISSDDEPDSGKANAQKPREMTKQGNIDEIEGAVTLKQKAQTAGRSNLEVKVEADGVNTKERNKPIANIGNSSLSSNVQNDKEESNRKRKLEILQKLQSVEKAIARKKQKIDGDAEE